MRPNDETIYNGTVTENEGNPQVEKENNKESWKLVGLGTATGILIGAGALYAGTAMAAGNNEENAEGEQTPDSSTSGSDSLNVAHVNPGQPFSEAFAQARAEVGPGGVFHWNGGVYNTYTKEEWDSMSAAEKNDFVAHARPEYSVEQIDTNHLTAETPQIHVQVDELHVHVDPAADDVHIVGQQDVPADDPGYTTEEFEFEGHQGVYVHPTDSDGHDIAIVDLNDNEEIDDGEIVDLETGEIYNTDGTVMTVVDMEDDNSETDYASDDTIDQEANDFMQYADNEPDAFDAVDPNADFLA